MEHRHLLPDEIDLLVDGEEGFGVAPLLAHVDRCDSCRAELDTQRRLVSRLEFLPHHAPDRLFVNAVMSQVRVFEPWHVAAFNAVQRLVPQSRPGRILAGATAAAMGVFLTLASLWLVPRINGVVFLATVVLERMRNIATDVAAGFSHAILGGTIASTAGAGITITVGALLLAILVAALGLRQLAAVSRRRRM